MTEEKHIISSCVISNKIILKNNEIFFSGDDKNVQSFLLSIYHYIKTDYPKFYKMDNLCKLGWLASEILLQHHSAIKSIDPADVGIVLTNKNASLDADVKYFQSVKEVASPALFVYTLPNIVTGEICIRNGFKGENSFFVFEDFNAEFLERYVNNLFSNNIVQVCMCGWVDVLDEQYKAALFLVAATKNTDALLFTKQNLEAIFKSI